MGYGYSFNRTPEQFIANLNRLGVGAQPARFLSGEFYLDNIYDVDLADRFTWALREIGPHLLEEDHVLDWIQENRPKPIKHIEGRQRLHPDFLDACKTLEEKAGVYSFWNHTRCLYVGKSRNLASRIETSFFERLGTYTQPVFLRYILTQSLSDMHVLEVWMIAELEPLMNVDSKSADVLSLAMPATPPWGDPIRVNAESLEANDGN